MLKRYRVVKLIAIKIRICYMFANFVPDCIFVILNFGEESTTSYIVKKFFFNDSIFVILNFMEESATSYRSSRNFTLTTAFLEWDLFKKVMKFSLNYFKTRVSTSEPSD
jgi:hypothetical protein